MRRAFLFQWGILAAATFIIAEPIAIYIFIAQNWSLDSWAPALVFIPITLSIFLPLFPLIFAWVISMIVHRSFPTFFSQYLSTLQIYEPYHPMDKNEQTDTISRRRRQDVLSREDVVKEIDTRVEALRIRTLGILVSMGLSLLAAAVVVLFAGRLTSIDAEAVSNLDRAKAEFADANRELSRLFQLKAAFTDMEALIKRLDEVKSKAIDTSQIRDAEKAVTDKRRDIANLQFARDSASPIDLFSATTLIDEEQKQVDELRKMLSEVWKKELLSDRGYGDWRYIVATAITRVGVVLIIVFLVQILMGFYRYNTRLTAYYNSRRDVLALWKGDKTGLKALHEVLTMPNIDFGKEPRHPLEDIIKAVGAQLGSSISRTNAKRRRPKPP
jgi:hypothetical protein